MEIAGDMLSYPNAEAMQDEFYASRWTDGLPVVPPTEERVAAMLGDRKSVV